MVDDFINPPAKDGLDPQGLLTIHYEGRVTRVPVSKNIGKKIPLEGGDVSVEIAQYLPNAKLQADGRYVNMGDRVAQQSARRVAGLSARRHKEPVRQVAKASFANPGGMHIEKCPVKFWYHHPAVAAEPAVEFLATSEASSTAAWAMGSTSRGARSMRATRRGLDQHRGLDRQLRAPCPPRVGLHAREGRPRRRSETFEAAAEVEVTAGDTTRSLWLQRGDGGGMPIPVKTSEGTLAISYGYESLPLGFSLQLKKFTRGMNPGGMGDASFASTVHLHDEAKQIDQDQRNLHERAAGPRKVHVLSIGNPAQRHGHGAHRGLRPGPVLASISAAS